MEEAEKGQRRIYAALAEAKKAVEHGKWKKTPLPESLKEEWRTAGEAYGQAMDDDLNTAQALGNAFACARLVNRLLEDRKLRSSEESGLIYEEFLERARRWHAELGLFGEQPDEFLQKLRNMRAKRQKTDMTLLREKLLARETARKNRDYAESDRLRDEIAGLGIAVRDTPAGQEWDFE